MPYDYWQSKSPLATEHTRKLQKWSKPIRYLPFAINSANFLCRATLQPPFTNLKLRRSSPYKAAVV